jgi:hypothetical protein
MPAISAAGMTDCEVLSCHAPRRAKAEHPVLIEAMDYWIVRRSLASGQPLRPRPLADDDKTKFGSHRLQTDDVAIFDAQPFERVRVGFADHGKLGQIYIRPFVPQRSQGVFLVVYCDEKVFLERRSAAAHALSGRSDFPDFAHEPHYDPVGPRRKRYCRLLGWPAAHRGAFASAVSTH